MGEDEFYILGAALRYQLGRSTYGSSIIADAIVEAVPRMHRSERAMLLRELTDPSLTHNRFDQREWDRAIHALQSAHGRVPSSTP